MNNLYRLTLPALLAAASLATGVRADVGWAGQALPDGLKRGTVRGEYVHEKSGLVFVYVPAGPSLGGGPPRVFSPTPPVEQPQQVQVAAFYIAKYEVSVGDFQRFVGATSYKTRAEETGYAWCTDWPQWKKVSGATWRDPKFPQTDKHPVVCMAWTDAQRYCEWAGLRLPTNIEWVKAGFWDASTSALRRQPWGDDWSNDSGWLRDHANWSDDYNDEVLHMKLVGTLKFNKDGWLYTAPVDSCPKGVSPYGAWNMSGNAMEWCADAKDPVPPGFPGGKARFANGGSYRLTTLGPDPMYFFAEQEAHQDIGFRPAISGP